MTTSLNDNLLLHRDSSGITLITPNTLETAQYCLWQGKLNLSDLLNMHLNIYIENKNNIILDINDACARLYGYESRESVLGLSLTDASKMDPRRSNNREIIKKSGHGIYHELITTGHVSTEIISVKFSWLHSSGKIQGVIASDFVIDANDKESIPKIITSIIRLFDATSSSSNSTNIKRNHFNQHLTKREIEVTQWVIRGKTMREIAEIMSLSIRTVESYFETIKKKADVKTKSQLIGKVINLGHASDTHA